MQGKCFAFILAVVAAAALAVPSGALAAGKESGVEEEAPQLKFLELHGYLRFRADLMYNMDLGTYNRFSGSYTSRILPPVSARTEGSGTFTPLKGNTLAGANMRFRVEPVINVSDEIRLLAQIDILDNIGLGTTPDAYNGMTGLNIYYPMPVFSLSAVPPHQGKNSFTDSITVKRAWAEVMTPFGQIRFGRMPSHWGLGVMVNDGSCFDCDGGSTADRVMFITKVLNHYIIPAVDFPSQGPTTKDTNFTTGFPIESYYQGIDADQRDDVQQYILVLARRDKPEEIKELLENGKMSINYGVYNVLRLQAYDYPNYYASGEIPQTAKDLVHRDVKLYIGSPWFRLHWKKLHIEFEADFIYGKMGDGTTTNPDVIEGDPDPDALNLTIFQYAAVLQADYKFLHDKLKVGFEAGMASGDRFPGWGILPIYKFGPFGPRQYGTYDPQGKKVDDSYITNFRFNPDYRIDLILWREVIGMFTDAWYVKPSIEYLITEGFGAGLEIIYSQAMFQESPSGNSRPLGIEFDMHLFYSSEDGFIAGIDYGVLVPFSGMDNLGAGSIRDDPRAANDPAYKTLGAEVAQRLRGYMGVRF
jgi:uncharacterized protein (TIGR04551 family)